MKDINFDLVRTVQVIQMDETLKSMFVKMFPTNDFNTVLEAAKKGILDKESSDYAEGVYNNIILSKNSLKELYMRNITTIPTKPSTVKKLPKEYNKTRIQLDIKERGDSKPNEFEKAMLALNDMKNIRARLNNKGKKQRYADGKPFTDAECREIIAVVGIIKNRLGKIK